MNPCELYSTWVEVDLGAIEGNIRYFVRQTGVQVMAVVKANGYGHGAVPVARAALKAGATWCSVARIEEAMELRRAGLDCPILLLGYTPMARFEEAIANQISLTVWNMEQIQSASLAASRSGKAARLHLKVDSGMSRIGVQPEEAFNLLQQTTRLPGIKMEGIFTHFARADEHDPAPTDAQEKTFTAVLNALEANQLKPPLVHASNSAASLAHPSAAFHLVRAGIAIYGLQPSSQWQLPSDFRPALCWKTVLSQVKMLPPGLGISYGHQYITQRNECIGTLPVGYADGFRRTTGNQAVVNGVRVPVVGRVCMDQSMVQLDAVPQAKVGDEVILIGAQGSQQLTAEDLALTWGTINYEVTCGIGPRVPRIYRNPENEKDL